MKFTALLPVLAALFALPAAAQTCTPRETSAYRADMKDKLHRQLVALSYCGHHRRRADMVPGTRHADACDAEMQKIADVMTAAKAYKEFQWALKGCEPQP